MAAGLYLDLIVHKVIVEPGSEIRFQSRSKLTNLLVNLPSKSFIEKIFVKVWWTNIVLKIIFLVQYLISGPE